MSAQGQNGNQGSMVDRIATKFNLKKEDVQKVFEEQHVANQAQRQKDMQSKIDQAVKDGKITQAQADKLAAKHKEMAEYMESLKDKTPEERRTAMKAKQTEMRKWMTDNNIPAGLMGPRGGERGMRGQMGHGGDSI